MGFHTLTIFRWNDKTNGKRTDSKRFVKTFQRSLKTFERYRQKNLTENPKNFNGLKNVFVKPFKRYTLKRLSTQSFSQTLLWASFKTQEMQMATSLIQNLAL